MEENCNTSWEVKKDLEILSERVIKIEANVDKSMNVDRANNILIFKLKDDEDSINNLINTVIRMLEKINISIPNAAIADAFRLGKIIGSRPVLIKFVAYY